MFHRNEGPLKCKTVLLFFFKNNFLFFGGGLIKKLLIKLCNVNEDDLCCWMFWMHTICSILISSLASQSIVSFYSNIAFL